MALATSLGRPRHRARTRSSATLAWLTQLLAWLVLFAILAVLAVGVVVPRIGGATPYTILTGSMRPTLPPGTLVVVRPVDPRTIGIGDVVTYQLRSGDPEVVTHRVVAQGRDAQGRPVFRTQGDANNAVDRGWVVPAQIKGTRWYSVPYLGYATSLITSTQRRIASLAIAAALLAYSAYTLTGAVRERRARRRSA